MSVSLWICGWRHFVCSCVNVYVDGGVCMSVEEHMNVCAVCICAVVNMYAMYVPYMNACYV